RRGKERTHRGTEEETRGDKQLPRGGTGRAERNSDSSSSLPEGRSHFLEGLRGGLGQLEGRFTVRFDVLAADHDIARPVLGEIMKALHLFLKGVVRAAPGDTAERQAVDLDRLRLSLVPIRVQLFGPL